MCVSNVSSNLCSCTITPPSCVRNTSYDTIGRYHTIVPYVCLQCVIQVVLTHNVTPKLCKEYTIYNDTIGMVPYHTTVRCVCLQCDIQVVFTHNGSPKLCKEQPMDHNMSLPHNIISKNKSVIATMPALAIHPSPSIPILSLPVIGVYQGKLYSSTIMGDLASVVANVIEHSSWEKSRRGRICCFPPKGGLHHTFGDASLEMRLDIPHWCYSYKSQSPSSRRTCAAAVEYRIMLQIHRGHSTNHRRCTV